MNTEENIKQDEQLTSKGDTEKSAEQVPPSNEENKTIAEELFSLQHPTYNPIQQWKFIITGTYTKKRNACLSANRANICPSSL